MPKLRIKKPREYRPILDKQRILSYDAIPTLSGYKTLTESDWLAHNENPLEWLLAWETITDREIEEVNAQT